MLRSAGGRGYRIGVVNPEALVGKEILALIRERGFPAEEVRLIGTSTGDDRTLMEGIDEPVLVRPADEGEFAGLDIVFFCGSSAETSRWIDLRDEHGFLAFDLTQPSAHRGAGPEVIAGINTDRVENDTSLILSPHPISTALAHVLVPILERFPIDLCAATVIEPASELDQPGIDEMFAQAVAVLNVQGPPTAILGRQAIHNIFPPQQAAEVEQYVVSQIESLLGDRVPLSLHVLRGAAFHSHSLSIYLELDGEVLDEELAALLDESEAVSVAEAEEPFGTLDAGGRDEILVARIAADPGNEGSFWIYVVSDNLRRTSALNAVLVAESVVERFGTPPN